MDITARGIDLIKTIMDIANSPDKAVSIAAGVMHRLGLEGVGQEELTRFLESAKSLAYPNGEGEKFSSQVIQGVNVVSAGPFAAITSGSLGRYLLFDRQLSWITTTITALYHFHDEDFIAGTMTSLIIQTNRQQGDKQARLRATPGYDPEYETMLPVIKKITSSVWLNIVNSGYAKLQLPEELRSVCGIGHHLDSVHLATAISQLNDPSRGSQVVITSYYMPLNLSHWLLYHFDGRFRIVVTAKTVYEAVQGNTERTIELRVDKRCEDGGTCAEKKDSAREFVMTEYVTGQWTAFFKGKSNSASFLGAMSRNRKALYSLGDWNTSLTPGLSSINSNVKQVASDLVRWLCALRVDPCVQSSKGIVYQVNLKQRNDDTAKLHTHLFDLLKKSPSILQFEWGLDIEKDWRAEGATKIYSPGDFAKAREERHTSPPNFSQEAESARRSLVLRCFPGVQDMITAVKCFCMKCKTHTTETSLQPGCLKSYAYASMLRLVAHSIADAFSAEDVSGSDETSLKDINPDVHRVERVLLDIAQYSRIVWQTWFEVASSVYLGRFYSIKDSQSRANRPPRADNSMIIAIQNGDLAVVAPWIDLYKEVTHVHSFGFIPVQGMLCVPNSRRGHTSSAYQSPNTQFVVIQTRETEHVDAEAEQENPARQLSHLELKTDGEDIEVDFILFPSDNEIHILLTRVRSARYSRLVNPCATAIMQSKRLHEPRLNMCDHVSSLALEESRQEAYQSSSLYSFDRLLGSWPTVSLKRLHMSQVFDTYLKYNIACALVQGGIVTVSESRCWRCPADKLLKDKKKQIGASSGLFLVHVIRDLKEGPNELAPANCISN